MTAAMRAAAAAGGGDDDGDAKDVAKKERETAVSAPAVKLVRCDFLVDDSWREADVVLVNSCCFSEALFASIESRAIELLKPGTLVVTLRQQFVNVVGGGGHDIKSKRQTGGGGGGGAEGDGYEGEEATTTAAVAALAIDKEGEQNGMSIKLKEEKNNSSNGGGGGAPRGEYWELLEATERRMSWGPSLMSVYRRTDTKLNNMDIT